MESETFFKSYTTEFNRIRYNLLFEYTEEKRVLISRNEPQIKIDELKEKYTALLEKNASKMKIIHENLLQAIEEELKREMAR